MIGKTGVVICACCKRPCEEDVFYGGHGSVRNGGTPLMFCSEECRDDYSGVAELIQEEVEQRTREEFKLIHDCVCPSCVRRLRKLL